MKAIGNNVKYVLIKILYIIIIPIILYDLLLIAQTIINPEKTPSFLGIKTFSIITGSMEPVIGIDDIVIVKEVNADELNNNDIISFKTNDGIITHRIINAKKEGNSLIYTTKGDNNEVTDIERVEFSQIEGKYIGKIPKISWLLSFFKNKIVFSVILIVLIISFIYEKKKISNKIRRREKRIKWDREKNYGNV